VFVLVIAGSTATVIPRSPVTLCMRLTWWLCFAEPSWYYWEIVIMARKVALIAISIFFGESLISTLVGRRQSTPKPNLKPSSTFDLLFLPFFALQPSTGRSRR
jgi:hypothetical protein